MPWSPSANSWTSCPDYLSLRHCRSRCEWAASVGGRKYAGSCSRTKFKYSSKSAAGACAESPAASHADLMRSRVRRYIGATLDSSIARRSSTGIEPRCAARNPSRGPHGAFADAGGAGGVEVDGDTQP